MRDLSKIKNQLKKTMMEDKYSISIKTIENIRRGVFEILKKYTKINDDSININIKLFKNNKYRIEIKTEIDDIY